MRFEMGNEKCVMGKAGVSLITVLMFMLIATIAATATYKWITSEGHSSASRMMEREAYQSSIAGLENARAWMTFHANETGALIRQYLFDEDGNPKDVRAPINLDKHIRSFAQENTQNHHVWLVGVNTTPPTFKVKILSEGRSRCGRAQHTEVAIFNVDGLYQVDKPKKTVERKDSVDFDYAYFGGSYHGAGDITLSSAVVNGNWSGNPQSVTGNFIVTGDAVLSGNNANIGQLACIGGNLGAENQGMAGKELYVGGTVTGQVKVGGENVEGNAYFDGDVNLGNVSAEGTKNLSIYGNVTLNGFMRTSLSSKDAEITGNLCTGENAGVVLNGGTYKFTVGGNVWMPGPQNLYWGSVTKSGSGCTCRTYSCQCNYDYWENGYHWVFSKACEKGSSSGNWRIKSETCTETGTQACNYGDPNFIECENYTNVMNLSENYEYNSNIDGAKTNWYKLIRLGNSATSEVYIKSGFKSSKYKSSLYDGKYFYQAKDYPRQCVDNTCNNKYWDGLYHHPYSERSVDDDRYYIYNMPANKTDVGIGTYTDGYWHKTLRNYFIDYYEADDRMNVRFTAGDHAYDEYHPVFVSYATDVPFGEDDKKYYRYLHHDGSNITGSPYCILKSGKNWQPECGVTPWFKSNATSDNFHNKDNWADKPFSCAEDVKDKCIKKSADGDGIMKAANGCDNSSYIVEDPIVTGKNQFEAYAGYGCAGAITAWTEDMVTKANGLNWCFDHLFNNAEHPEYKDDSLYNGFLVVRVSAGSTNSINPTGKLKGRFIIIVEDAVNSKFIDVEDTSYVFYYMEQGITQLKDATRKNTFIYSEGEIGDGLNFNLTGTIYATAASCAGMGSLQSSSITSDPVLNQLLAKAGIICDNDKDHNENNCGGDMSGSPLSSGSTTVTYGTAGKDNYFVSTAPQLGVTLESQYTTTETPPVINDDNKELAPSFIVLPRIIYLTKDPDGKLSDYYNVLPLNGANVTKATANVSCDPSLNIGNVNLVSDDETLAEGLYNCKAEPDGYEKVPFWVWVQGSQSSSPLVSFVEQSENITPGEPHEVKINLPPHAAELQVKVEASGIPAGWTVTYDDENVSVSGSVYTIRFGAELSGYTTPTILTVTPPANAENGSLTFVLKTPEENAGYQLGNPWSTTLLIATTTILVNQAYDNSSLVSPQEINAWCADNTGCPDVNSRKNWPDCPYKTTKQWVVPNWTPGYSKIVMNSSWNVVTGGEGTLSLRENEGSGCVVIIPASNNSIEAPILKESTYYLRAIAKAKSRKLTLKFVGDAGADLIPAVTVSMGSGSKPCSDNDTDRTCVVSVFDGDYVKVYLDETAENNANFSYWKCLNNGGSSCPTTDLITSYVFGTTPNDNGFLLKDDNAVIEIHFGEQDKHCFFDEFRRTQDNNTTHSCDYPGESETEYCIGSGTNAKWKLVSGGNTGYIKRDPYQGYVVASSTAPNTGVKVLSTVDAGIRGTLKALFSPPHATASFDKDSWKIKNSGFLLRAKSDGTDPLFLNVYENTSGRLAARLCGGSSCLDEVELLKSGSGVNVTTSSMVMLSATLEDENTLKLRAYTGNYYSSGTIPESDYYKAEFDLSGLSNNHADMTYQYIGFSLADRDFKIYGIGWQSDDYNSECFDGPPSIKCSFAATAVDGFIPTNGSAPGQSTAYQKPWVGHSGWFDSKSCQVSYSYETVGSTDAIVDAEGYKFDASGAGAHGYKDPDTHNDIKTAYASLSNCVYMSNPTQAAWTSTVTPAHCGAFWTGQTHDCKKDNPDLLAGETKYIAGNGNEWKTFAAQNLRGVDELTVAISNDNEYSVDLEMWLESQSAAWGGTNYESRHVRITGNNKSFTRTFNVKNDLADNASGFDPENVVSIQFKNNLNTAVTVSKVVAPCTKAVHFEGCSVEKNGETGWKMTLDVPDNPDKLKKMTVKATVDGGNYTGLSKTEFDYSDFPSLVLTFSDPGRYANAGRTYEFSAQVYSEENEYTSEFETCTCTGCSIGAITCSSDALSSSQIEEGEANPQFHFELSGCPSKGCAYEVWLNGSKIKECTKTQAESASGCPGDNPTDVHITGSASLSKSDEPYVYEVKNVDGTPTPISGLDDCKRSFKVVEHVLADVTCDIGTVSSSASSLGGTQAIPHGNVTVSCEGGGCEYTIKEGSSVVGGPTTYTENYDLSFTGASEAGKHEYTAVMQRGNEDAVNCAGKYTLTYPLSVTCGPIGAIGSAESPHDPSASVSAGPSSVVGCGSNCTWTLTGGVSPSPNSSSGYDDGNITFTDDGATGEQDYTLTIKHAGTADVSCDFKVTYTTPSSSSVASSSSAGGCECTCGDCTDIKLTTFSENHNGPGMFCFFVDNENLNMRMDSETQADNASNHCIVSINGSSKKKFNQTALKDLVNTKKDGGYYIYVGNDASAVQNSHYCSFQFPTGNHTSSTNPCAGGGGASSSSAAPSSSSAAPASSSGGGCVCGAFVNGSGGGYGGCYNSGLQNMTSGKCYAINRDRNPPLADAWINNSATDSYWWMEVSCSTWTGCL